MSLLLQIAQTRALWAKCEMATGLDWHEIATLLELEALFAPPLRDERRYSRHPLQATAHVRAGQLDDEAEIIDISLEGMRLGQMPYIEHGATIEIIANEPGTDDSFRFKAEVMWSAEIDNDVYEVGVRLLGAPLQFRRRPSERTGPDVATRSHRAAAA